MFLLSLCRVFLISCFLKQSANDVQLAHGVQEKEKCPVGRLSNGAQESGEFKGSRMSDSN